ncbi:hypothetical protein IMZ48_14140 [Candidatus Bathyarchaeota archaeon]|nr:hypothetical protein [Candidatus Bathyarchaeota archaeon]
MLSLRSWCRLHSRYFSGGSPTLLSSMDVDSLDRVLKERGISIEKAKLAAALGDPSFSSWADLHLTPATLLTPDELATYVTCLSCPPLVCPPRSPNPVPHETLTRI